MQSAHRSAEAAPPRPRWIGFWANAFSRRTRSPGTADSHVISYRADVDGLRAIAVLSVVFFHLLRQGLPGGYLGVDIFFVVSGYLITAIIWREVQEERFSITRFYDRRIRRVMPALLFVLIVTTAFSAALLLPSDLMGYGRSLLATLAFSANIYFWRDTNYFSTAAEQKPLLHIWSLGVEEQFYILFPLMLLVLGRRWPRAAGYVVALITAASFTANALALRVGASVPTFFLLPTRAWELGLGALLAMSPAGTAPRGLSAAALSLAGGALIAAAVLRPMEACWFIPAALPAALGAALIILAGQRERHLANKLLQAPPVVFIGLISYSLYLWHWPIIVLAQYYLVRPFTPAEMGAALILMTACAMASWAFIERPFRSAALPIVKVRLATAAGVGCLALAAALLLSEQGLPGRLSAAAASLNLAVDTNYRCALSDYLAFGGSRACVMNLPSRNPEDAEVVLLGNSHAQMYAPLWAAILKERAERGLLVPANGCLPTVRANINRACIITASENLRAVSALQHSRAVILGLNWTHGPGELVDSSGRVLDNGKGRALADALDDLIDRLLGHGKRVIVIGPIAEPGFDVASTLSRELAFGHPVDRDPFLPAADFRRRFGALIAHFEARRDITFVRPDTVQCPAERCFYVIDGHSLFSDRDHLAAAELPRFRSLFEAALGPASGDATQAATASR